MTETARQPTDSSQRETPESVGPDVAEIITIVDDQLDVPAILEEIRANLARREPLQPDPRDFVYRPREAVFESTQAEIEWAIEQASAGQRDLLIGDQQVAPSSTVGAAVARLKRPLHQLARYYVDLLARKQAALDGHTIRALSILATRSEGSQRELESLRAEIAQLRNEISSLRDTSPTSDD